MAWVYAFRAEVALFYTHSAVMGGRNRLEPNQDKRSNIFLKKFSIAVCECVGGYVIQVCY